MPCSPSPVPYGKRREGGTSLFQMLNAAKGVHATPTFQIFLALYLYTRSQKRGDQKGCGRALAQAVAGSCQVPPEHAPVLRKPGCEPDPDG